MRQSLIMTILGNDRPGLVRSVSEIVACHGGSWQESRMVHLAGQFAGVIRVDGSPNDIQSLLADLESNGIPGLSIHAVRENVAEPATPATVHLEVTGNDRPGIIRELSAAIATCGGNVEELNTGLESAPMSGHSIFRASCQIALPAGTDAASIISAIENLGPDLTADITG